MISVLSMSSGPPGTSGKHTMLLHLRQAGANCVLLPFSVLHHPLCARTGG